MNKCYRVVAPPTGLQPASALLDRVYTEVPAAKPDHPTCYEGEWVCDHAPCPVRAVRLRVKAHFHRHLPRLRCPLCLRTLDFRHWLSVICLQEVPPEPPPKITAVPPATKRATPRKRKKSPVADAPSGTG